MNLQHCKTPSHNLCGSCDLASKFNYVTGDELEIDVSIELFRNQTILRWCRCLCGYSSYHTDLVTVPPTESNPSINCTFQQEDTTVVKKFQHILGLCSSSQQRRLENRYHASNLCMKLEFFIGQKYTLLLNC